MALARQIRTIHQGLKYLRESAVSRAFDERESLRRRPAIMDVAIRQDQRCQPVGIMRGENLRDRAAAIVGDEIGLLDSERVHELGEHPRLSDKRNILRPPDFAVAQPHQVKRDAAPPVLNTVDDMAPVVTVERHPMDKKRGMPLAFFEIGDPARFDLGEAAARVKRRDVHKRVALRG